MTRPKFVHLLFLILALGLAPLASAAEMVRTDINPALLYYQAFALYPDLAEQDRQHLFVPDWRGRPIDARFEKLIAKYDNTLKLVRHAGLAEVPCDWGVDLSEGPEALLPGLAKAKMAAQTTRLRVLWHLKHGRQTAARDELIATFKLSRNVSRDGLLISALVQFAMENILTSIIAENFHQFSPETLEQLMAGFDASPARGTVQASMKAEKVSFRDWFVNQVRGFQAETPGDDAKVMEKVRALLARTLAEGENPDNRLAERVLAVSQGTSAGLLARLQELDPLYEEATRILGLPFDQYEPAARAFDEKLQKHPNPFVTTFFPAFSKSRGKELAVVAKLEMVRAAIAYRLRGEKGFKQILNPSGQVPFEMDRFFFEDVDRGFILKSSVRWTGYEDVLIFVEKDGPAFQVHGKNAGQPVARDPATK